MHKDDAIRASATTALAKAKYSKYWRAQGHLEFRHHTGKRLANRYFSKVGKCLEANAALELCINGSSMNYIERD
jgi:hypothetical protein